MVKWTASLPTLRRVEQVIGGAENGSTTPVKTMQETISEPHQRIDVEHKRQAALVSQSDLPYC